MKQLVCYTVEGLMCQGPHQVWVTLGSYRTAEQAQAAQRIVGADKVRETRILPYFRTTDHYPGPHIRPSVRPTLAAVESVASVVA
jgi:hypothetical protein